MIEDLVKGLFEVIFEDAGHQPEEPCSVFVIHKTVVEYTEDLMDKQAYHSMLVLQRLLPEQQAALNDAREIS